MQSELANPCYMQSSRSYMGCHLGRFSGKSRLKDVVQTNVWIGRPLADDQSALRMVLADGRVDSLILQWFCNGFVMILQRIWEPNHCAPRRWGWLLHNGPREGRLASTDGGHCALIQGGRERTFRPGVLYSTLGPPPLIFEGGGGSFPLIR
jgi:hypothetical protein